MQVIVGIWTMDREDFVRKHFSGAGVITVLHPMAPCAPGANVAFRGWVPSNE
jgi:hypothetical protein